VPLKSERDPTLDGTNKISGLPDNPENRSRLPNGRVVVEQMKKQILPRASFHHLLGDSHPCGLQRDPFRGVPWLFLTAVINPKVSIVDNPDPLRGGSLSPPKRMTGIEDKPITDFGCKWFIYQSHVTTTPRRIKSLTMS
jgi:hypothetical protein